MPNISQLLDALAYAALKHRDQRRKDAVQSPYINHPIEVCRLLASVGGVADQDVLVAALLHDVVEDTETTFEELERRFGAAVRSLVAEVTDDKSLDWRVRKDIQIRETTGLTPGAKAIRIADKISNVCDIAHNPPNGWSEERRRAYLAWTVRVVDGCRGTNRALEDLYDTVIREAKRLLQVDE